MSSTNGGPPQPGVHLVHRCVSPYIATVLIASTNNSPIAMHMKATSQAQSTSKLQVSGLDQKRVFSQVVNAWADGDDTGYGQALFPVPAEDPNDPLQWSKSKKTTILVIVCVYSFLGNSALLGVGPYITLWSEVFGVSQAEASTLISYPNLAVRNPRSYFLPVLPTF